MMTETAEWVVHLVRAAVMRWKRVVCGHVSVQLHVHGLVAGSEVAGKGASLVSKQAGSERHAPVHFHAEDAGAGGGR